MKPSQMLCAVALLVAPAATPQNILQIADRLAAASPYQASARYEVLLPQYEDPVCYRVSLSSTSVDGDTLSPCNYLIDWSMRAPEGESHGFNAYEAGHHYRFRDRRLQEYHADADATPFAPQSRVDLGVQQQAQFVQLLPQYIAGRLRAMAADSCFSYSIRPGRDGSTLVLSGSQSYGGVEAMTFSYTFSASDSLPLASEFCYNPSQMSEQTVSVKYGPASASAVAAYDEPTLMALYPEAFGKYRESSYTLENLPGRPLPEFTATLSSGERYIHHLGETFATPVVLAIVDPEVADTPALIAQLRGAIDASPRVAGLIVACAGSHADDIDALLAPGRSDETILANARSVARSCGVAAMPAVIVVGADGVVKNIHVGFNKDLASVVMQEISIAN